MNQISINQTDLQVSRIGYGCMQIGGDWTDQPISQDAERKAAEILEAALDQGINFFDHADIYCRGKSEEVFSRVWARHPGLRSKVVLQSKCGIRFPDSPHPGDPARYDFSYDYILTAVEGSLRRLKTDYLDLLLLHRPDTLVEPEDVAKAFDELFHSGKVRYFGVSNHNPAQIELLKGYLNQPIVVNQVELSLLHTHLINEGVVVNQDLPASHTRGHGILEYCRLHNISLQAWSPLAKGQLSPEAAHSPDERIARTAAVVMNLAHRKNVQPEAIQLAWILRHPAIIQPLVGTTTPQRLKDACQASQVELTREEWYALFEAGRGDRVP